MDVILQDAKSKRLVAKGRYTEQAPHGIRAKASSYLHNAAAAARAAVQRLQQSAESITHKAEDVLFEDLNEEHAESAVMKAKGTPSAYVASATASVKAAAQKLQHAAETVLHSADTASTYTSSDVRRTPECQLMWEAFIKLTELAMYITKLLGLDTADFTEQCVQNIIHRMWPVTYTIKYLKDTMVFVCVQIIISISTAQQQCDA